jgi:hypothetical protein
LDRAVGPCAHPDAEVHLAGPEEEADRVARLHRQMQASALCREPVGELTGTGAEATTVWLTPPSSAGRRIAILGSSVPAILLACTLAETRTPPSGASTVALRSANCR